MSEPLYSETIPCMRSVIMDPWAIETKHSGADAYNFFREIFIPRLKDIVTRCVEELRNEADLS